MLRDEEVLQPRGHEEAVGVVRILKAGEGAFEFAVHHYRIRLLRDRSCMHVRHRAHGGGAEQGARCVHAQDEVGVRLRVRYGRSDVVHPVHRVGHIAGDQQVAFRGEQNVADLVEGAAAAFAVPLLLPLPVVLHHEHAVERDVGVLHPEGDGVAELPRDVEHAVGA